MNVSSKNCFVLHLTKAEYENVLVFTKILVFLKVLHNKTKMSKYTQTVSIPLFNNNLQ